MKKRILLLLALVLLACGLSGCREEEAPFAAVPNPVATIRLTNGKSMRFELYVQEAPNTVANFVELANSGFYDGLRFFRIVTNVLVQAGDPRNNGTGHAEHAIQGEFAENGIENNVSHVRGTISMSRQSRYDTASSQFFILLGNYPDYNGKYAAFGQAMDEESLEVLEELGATSVDGNYSPMGPVPNIESIRVETYGYEYEAAKMDFPVATKAPEGEESNESGESGEAGGQ